jgi:hypothetical protein
MRYRLGLLIALAVFATGFLIPAPAAAKEKKESKPKVPEVVLNAFTKAYPNAEITGSGKAKRDHETLFAIQGNDSGVVRDYLYEGDGTLVEIDQKIPPTSLPLAVLQGITAAHPRGETVKATKIIRGDITEFRLELKEDSDFYALTVASNGKITKSKKLNQQFEDKENEIEYE